MKIMRSIAEPIRVGISWEERWASVDRGLIACWERGRETGLEAPTIASQAREGQLVPLPWKGGVEKATKVNRKFGSLQYLAMWQGLRGEDLHVDTEAGATLTCTLTQMTVVFTDDLTKYAEE